MQSAAAPGVSAVRYRSFNGPSSTLPRFRADDETCHFRTHAPQQDERSCTAIRSPRRRRQKRRRHVEAERLRHDQVNDEVELGRLLDRKIGGLRPPQNLVN